MDEKVRIGLTVSRPRKEYYAYKRAIESSGGKVFYLGYDLPQVDLESLDGLVISGGSDIHPSFYNFRRKPWATPVDECGFSSEATALRKLYSTTGLPVGIYNSKKMIHPKAIKTDIARDEFEIGILRKAVSFKKPVLGICRGMQIINCFLGGSLYQDIDDEFPPCGVEKKHRQNSPPYNISKDTPTHAIIMKKNSWLYKVFGRKNLYVNSTHHQAVKKTGRGLRVTSVSQDGIIESVEKNNSSFIIGVQFHPESLVDKHPEFLKIFKEFVNVCKKSRR